MIDFNWQNRNAGYSVNRNVRKATRALGLVVLSLALLTGFQGGSGPVMAQGATTISLSPTPLLLEFDGTGFVDVMVGDFASTGGLGAYILAISYDNSVVEVTSIEEGDAPFSGGPPAVGNETGGGPFSRVDNGAGEVQFAAFQASQATGPVGNFRIARINFRAVGVSGATSPITVVASASALIDAKSGDSVVVTTASGSVVIPPGGNVRGTTTLQLRDVTAGRVLVEVSCPSGFKGEDRPEDDGSWQIADVPAETCTLTATAPGYLKAEGTLTVGEIPVVVPANLLLGGDSDKNNFININDITGIIGKFGQTAVNCEIEGQVVDVDCNNFVNINDITGAIPNFGKGTQPFPTS